MLFTEVIRKKRDGGPLDMDDIRMLVDGLADGNLPAEQVSALAMAIFLNGMTFEEAGLLTTAMAASGRVLDWEDAGLDGPVADKHSTGGVGDKVSFLLAPVAAACGIYVPMISGRGLGHTGGTLDKLESVPGYDTQPGLDVFRKVVRDAGCAIIGQTGDLAPADKRFYAIRDVTGTVESIPLITASILSKKIAAGNHALVMDVKAGSGAFMSSLDRARALAESILGIAGEAGLKTHALLTDMNQVLGRTAGNALEIAESVAYLTGGPRDPRLHDVTMALSAEMLLMTELADSREAARARVEKALDSGAAAEAFRRMLAALGGPADFMERADRYLPQAAVSLPVHPDSAGYLAEMDVRAVGNAVITLGGGRRRVEDELDLSVGLSDVAGIGEAVGPDGRPLAVIHAADTDAAEAAAGILRAACRIEEDAPCAAPVIYDYLTQ